MQNIFLHLIRILTMKYTLPFFFLLSSVLLQSQSLMLSQTELNPPSQNQVSVVLSVSPQFISLNKIGGSHLVEKIEENDFAKLHEAFSREVVVRMELPVSSDIGEVAKEEGFTSNLIISSGSGATSQTWHGKASEASSIIMLLKELLGDDKVALFFDS